MLYLICELGYSEQLSKEGLKNCKEFVRTVLYSGNLNETYLETRVGLYQNQPLASTSPMTIPPDEDFLTLFTGHIIKRLYRTIVYPK